MHENDPNKSLDAPNINSLMNNNEKVLRSVLMNNIIEKNHPLLPEEIKGEQEKLLLESLVEKGLISCREDGAITSVYPVSAVPTSHHVQLSDGRSFYAMCAIDSLGVAYEFNKDFLISSSCRKCNTPVTVEISAGVISQSIPSTTHVSHVSIENYKDWASSC